MDAQVWIDPGNRLVVGRLEGTLTSVGVRQLRDLTLHKCRVPAEYHRLIDARGLTDARIEHAEFASAAHAVSATTASSLAKRAVITDSNLFYGLWRVFQGYALRYWPEMRVFRTAAEALEWLALPPDYLDTLGEPSATLGAVGAPTPDPRPTGSEPSATPHAACAG